VFATHTLPLRSTAIPAGVASDESVIPPVGDTAVPAFVKRLTLLFPAFETHTWPRPSMATAAGPSSPPVPEAIALAWLPTWLVSASADDPVPTLHTLPALSIATAAFAPLSALVVIPNPFPASSLVPPPPSTIHTLSPLTTRVACALFADHADGFVGTKLAVIV
jgi:hypothetical protein